MKNLYNQLNVNGTLIITFAATKNSKLEYIYTQICDKLMQQEMASFAYVFKRSEGDHDVCMITLEKMSETKLEIDLVTNKGEWVDIYENYQKNQDICS